MTSQISWISFILVQLLKKTHIDWTVGDMHVLIQNISLLSTLAGLQGV